MQKLNSLQEFRNFQDKSNSIEQNKCSLKFTIVFYCLYINKKYFATIKTCV